MGQMFCIILHKEIILVYGLPVREPWFSEVNNLFHGYIAGDAEQGFAFRWFYTEFAYLFQLCYATWGHFHVLINFLFLSLFFLFFTGLLHMEDNVCRVPFPRPKDKT